MAVVDFERNLYGITAKMVVPKQVVPPQFYIWYSSLDILRMHISFDGDHFDLQQLRKIMGTYRPI